MTVRRLIRAATALLSLLVLASPALAQEQQLTPEEQAILRQAEALDRALRRQQGTITLGTGVATMNVPRSFDYIDRNDTDRLLQYWGNPPDTNTLGALLPSGVPAYNTWAVILTFDPIGYVSDDDAEDIDYAELLTDMKAGTREDSEQLVRSGYASVELIGWAEPPHYERASHTLFWAKELQFGDSTARTLNYDVRMLGRRGVLSMNAVGTMQEQPQIETAMREVMDFTQFAPGHTYAEFDPSSDNVAAVGIGALIAGGAMAKGGFFKAIGAILLAGKKLVVVGVLALGAFAKRLFGRGENA